MHTILKLGIVKASVLGTTYPLFATIFGAILLRENFGIRQIIPAAIAFLGLGIVITDGHDLSMFGNFGTWELFALAGAMLGGFALVLVKQLSGTESTATIFFAQCLVGFWLFLAPAASGSINVSSHLVLVLLGIGILASIGQLSLTAGMRHVSISTSAIFTMLGPVMTCAIGAVFFHERLSGGMIIGSVLVFGACAAILLLKNRPKHS